MFNISYVDSTLTILRGNIIVVRANWVRTKWALVLLDKTNGNDSVEYNATRSLTVQPTISELYCGVSHTENILIIYLTSSKTIENEQLRVSFKRIYVSKVSEPCLAYLTKMDICMYMCVYMYVWIQFFAEDYENTDQPIQMFRKTFDFY